MKNFKYILLAVMFLLASKRSVGQVLPPTGSVSIECPGTVVAGNQFMVTERFNYANVTGGSIIMTLSYDNSKVDYVSNSSTYIPVVTGTSGGIRTLTFTIPVNSGGIDQTLIQCFFNFICPSVCIGTNISANFSGNILIPGMSLMSANSCTTNTSIINNWAGSNEYVNNSYNCERNTVTFKLDISGGTCFGIQNPKITITPSIPGATVLSSYTRNNTGNYCNNTLNGNNIQVCGAINPNLSYSVYYTIQLPCGVTYPEVIKTDAQLFGDNCGTNTNPLVDFNQALFALPSTTTLTASLQANLNNSTYNVSVQNSGSTATNLSFTTIFPSVKINAIYLTSGISGLMSLFDCNNNLINTYTSFPILNPPLATKAVYTINNLTPGNIWSAQFYYDKTNSCVGTNSNDCVEFNTFGNYVSNVSDSACNCSLDSTKHFANIKSTYCIQPELSCNNMVKYEAAQCFQSNDSIPMWMEFRNCGTSDLLNGQLLLPFDSSLVFLGNLLLNGVPVSGTLSSSNVLTVSLPTIFKNCSVYRLSFDTKVSGTASFGSHNYFAPLIPHTYFGVPLISGSNMSLKPLYYPCFNSFKVCVFPSVDVVKLVSGDKDGGNYSLSGSGTPGSVAHYKIIVKNNGNIAIKDIELVDRMPSIGDKAIASCTNRNSQFNMIIANNPLLPSSLNSSIQYNRSTTTNNLPNSWLSLIPPLPNSCNNYSTSFNPVFSANDNTLKIKLTNPIQPFDSDTFEIKVQIDPNAKPGEEVCNSIAMRCYTQNPDGSRSDLNVNESNLACLTIAPPPCKNCQTTLKSASLSTTQTNGTTSAGNISFTTTVPVQQVTMSVADVKYNWNKEGCQGDCNTPINDRACMLPFSNNQTIGGANGLQWSDFTNTNVNNPNENKCLEELKWNNDNTLALVAGSYEIPFNINLPKPLIEGCCKLELEKLCVRLRFKDINCNICDTIICLSDIQKDNDCCSGSSWIKTQYIRPASATTTSNAKVIKDKIPTDKLDPKEESACPIFKDCPKDFSKCNETINLTLGASLKFAGQFKCNTNITGCGTRVVIKIKKPNGVLETNFNQNNAYTFNSTGIYEVEFEGYCGDKLCNVCKQYIKVEKDCCPTTETRTGNDSIYVTNFKGSISKQILSSPLSNPSSSLKTYSSCGSVTVKLGNYNCISGCPASYEWKRSRKNSSGQYIQLNGSAGTGTGSSTLVFTPTPENALDRITISLKCGDKSCKTIQLFDLKNCIESHTQSPNIDFGTIKQEVELPACTNCENNNNLVVNGDFEAGNTGFSNQLTYNPSVWDLPNYNVATNTYPFNNALLGNGKYFVIHSYYNHTGQLYGKTVWKTINTIPVTKNKSYNFCFRLLTAWGPYQVDHANMNAGDPNLRVDVLINNQLVLHNARVGSLNVVNNFVPGSSVGDGFNNTNWQQFNVAWNSNASTTATLEIRFVDMALIPIGFGVKPDYPIVSNFTFGLDDIVFKECSTTPAALPRVKVPGTGSIKSNEIFLLTNGEFTEDKTPITSRIITGNVSGLQKPAEIKISQAETNDVGTALTDAYGNFAIRVNGDTAHKIYINGVEYGKIKVQSDGNLQAFQSGGKCTKLITQCSQTATSGDCGDCDDAHRLICGFKEVVIECPPTTTTSTVTTKSQLSASCPTGYTMVQGKCIPDVIVNAPWLDLKTGQIKFFEYKEDMVVDNPAICKYLGVKEFVIKKGKYEIDRSNVNEGASCRLPVVVTVKLPTGKPPVLKQIFEGTNPKGMDCKTYGNSCFWATESNNMEKVQYSIIPIIKNGEIVGIQLVYPPDANGKGNGPPKAAGF